MAENLVWIKNKILKFLVFWRIKICVARGYNLVDLLNKILKFYFG